MNRTAPEFSHRTRTLWLVGILHAFTHLYGVALLPLYLHIQQDLKLASIQQATLFVTVYGLSYFLPSYPLGIMADRLNRKALLGIGLAINGMGFVGLALAPTYSLALASMVIAGIGGSFYHPAATALIAQLFPRTRGRALGLAGIGASAGFFFGPLYTGWRALDAGSWRTPILELGLAGIVAAAAFLMLAKDCPEHQPQAVTHNKPRGIFPTLAIWALFLGASLFLSLRDFGGSAMATSSSLFFQTAHGFDAKLTGIALSGLFVASAISNPLFGGLSDRGRIPCLAALLVCAAALMLLFPRVPAKWSVPVLLGYGFFFMATYPVTEAALMEAVPNEVRGRVFGLFITIGGLIANLSHWLVGDWVGRLGSRASDPGACYVLYAALAAMVVCSLAALPLLRALHKREQPVPTPAGATALSALHSPDQP